MSNKELWDEYVTHRQTYAQLAEKYDYSVRIVLCRNDRYRMVAVVHSPRRVVVVMDTTCWSRDFGMMLFKDELTSEDLLWYFVKTETVRHVREDRQGILCGGFLGQLKSRLLCHNGLQRRCKQKFAHEFFKARKPQSNE